MKLQKITLHNDISCVATITEHRDGTATLRVRIYTGEIIHNKVHKNVKAAKAAWYRMN